MTYSFDDLRQKGNGAVAYALNDARFAFHEGRLDGFKIGYVLGQILVAYCDLFADDYNVQGARNEIHFLREVA